MMVVSHADNVPVTPLKTWNSQSTFFDSDALRYIVGIAYCKKVSEDSESPKTLCDIQK